MKRVTIALPFAFLLSCAGATPPAYDVDIENGTVVDGAGADRFEADVGVRDGRRPRLRQRRARLERRHVLRKL